MEIPSTIQSELSKMGNAKSNGDGIIKKSSQPKGFVFARHDAQHLNKCLFEVYLCFGLGTFT
jgi:hypothetical protein